MKGTTMRVLTIPLLFLLCGLAAEADPAQAMVSPAAVCRGETRTQQSYEAGQRAGANIVKQAWATVDDCRRVDELRRVVDDSLSRLTSSKNSTLFVKCRYWGLTDGVEEELARVESSCRRGGGS
jgi:hypothetical protein